MVLAAPSSPSDANLGSQGLQDVSFLGRPLASPPKIIELTLGWIDQCFRTHSDSCTEKYESTGDFHHLTKETYFGVVDIHDMKITELPFETEYPRPHPFVALSYVWGKDKVRERLYMTTRSNVMLRIQPGGLISSWDAFPRTIQNAIQLTRLLGYRYIWIDSLCIVQDSTHNWQCNAKAMHLVYLHATLTICAADGDVTEGLHALQRAPIQQDPSDPIPAAEPLEIARTGDGLECTTLSAICQPGVELLVSKLPESVIQDSEWNERAWTFQERILSRRCLIFAGDRVYFQCRQMVMSEAAFPDKEATGWSLDWTNSPLQTLGELTHKAFWFYMRAVGLYTSRKLSRSGDVLAAFEGVSWLLQQHLNAPLLFGLPTSHFDLALLWSPLESVKRRNTNLFDHESSMSADTKVTGSKEFPSWSWCGWQYGKIGYIADIIEGCLENPQEWLRHHTWIQWHVRDDMGYLRPLWNRNEQYIDSSLDRRWSGYTGLPKSASPEAWRRQFITDPWGPIARGGSSNGVISRNGAMVQNHRKRIWEDISNNGYEPLLHDRQVNSNLNSTHCGSSHSLNSHREPNTAYIAALPPADAPSTHQFQTPSVNIVYGSSAEKHFSIASPGERTKTTSEEKTTSEKKSTLEEDDYGRTPRYDSERQQHFTSILPDNPFGVTRHSSSIAKTKTHDMPILQFFTLSTSLYIKVRAASDIKSSHSPLLCEVIDKAGDWCGCIKLDRSWIAERQDSLLHYFIAISDAKSFTMEECPEWNYYIHKERKESEWDLYYVLLLERDIERALWQRVGLGKVFQAAFVEANWAEIKLG